MKAVVTRDVEDRIPSVASIRQSLGYLRRRVKVLEQLLPIAETAERDPSTFVDDESTHAPSTSEGGAR